jgi:hypothetical protein
MVLPDESVCDKCYTSDMQRAMKSVKGLVKNSPKEGLRVVEIYLKNNPGPGQHSKGTKTGRMCTHSETVF